MIQKIVDYYVVPIGETPSLSDIKTAIMIAAKNDCIVRIGWHVNWNGHYSRLITATDDAEEYYKNSIPHVYGL